jgi:hypothetical protein
MSVEEAEGKMMEILEDLFKYEGNDETVIDGEIAIDVQGKEKRG